MNLQLKFYFFVFLKKEKDFDAQNDLAQNTKLYAFGELLAYEEELQGNIPLKRKKILFRQFFKNKKKNYLTLLLLHFY